jgi:pyrimidine operon attenuation protein/uracil phosphoribosyltransferase
MKGRRKREILDQREIERAIRRIAYEIVEKNRGAKDLILLGIPAPGRVS